MKKSTPGTRLEVNNKEDTVEKIYMTKRKQRFVGMSATTSYRIQRDLVSNLIGILNKRFGKIAAKTESQR